MEVSCESHWNIIVPSMSHAITTQLPWNPMQILCENYSPIEVPREWQWSPTTAQIRIQSHGVPWESHEIPIEVNGSSCFEIRWEFHGNSLVQWEHHNTVGIT